MSRIAEPTSRVVRLVGWGQLFLFGLNVAWITAWCKPDWDFKLFIVRYDQLSLRFWELPLTMPEGAAPLHQVMLTLVFSVPFFIGVLLLVRVAAVEVFLRAFAGAFAIAAFPLVALHFGFPVFGPVYPPYPSGTESAPWLLQILGVLGVGVVYYFRRRSFPWALGLLVLIFHFSLWAWKAGTYTYTYNWWRYYSSYPYPLIVILVDYTYFFGFPVIGFLSALSTGWYLRLSSDQAPRAAGRPA